MNSNTGCWVAYTTVDSQEKARAMAHELVKKRLVACVNIVGPVESVFEWQAQVEQVSEWMLMMKCSDEQREDLMSAVVSMHDYEVPEMIILPIAEGHTPYLEWIRVRAAGEKA